MECYLCTRAAPEQGAVLIDFLLSFGHHCNRSCGSAAQFVVVGSRRLRSAVVVAVGVPERLRLSRSILTVGGAPKPVIQLRLRRSDLQVVVRYSVVSYAAPPLNEVVRPRRSMRLAKSGSPLIQVPVANFPPKLFEKCLRRTPPSAAWRRTRAS